MKKTLFTLMVLLATITLSASTLDQQNGSRVSLTNGKGQTMKLHYGFYAGVNKSSFTLSAENNILTSVVDYAIADAGEAHDFETPHYQMRACLTAGAFVQIPLFSNFYLESGLQYSRNAYTNTTPGYKLGFNELDQYIEMAYAFKESYKVNTVNVPVLFGYEFAITPLVHFGLSTGPVLNVVATAKLGLDGRANYSISNFGGLVEQGITSTIEGEANLMSGIYDLTQECYLDGNQQAAAPDAIYKISNDDDYGRARAMNAYRRCSASWRFGANVGVGPVSLFLHYDLGITNMLNDSYWHADNGVRVPGCIVMGTPRYKEQHTYDNEQTAGVIAAGISYRF